MVNDPSPTKVAPATRFLDQNAAIGTSKIILTKQWPFLGSKHSCDVGDLTIKCVVGCLVHPENYGLFHILRINVYPEIQPATWGITPPRWRKTVVTVPSLAPHLAVWRCRGVGRQRARLSRRPKNWAASESGSRRSLGKGAHRVYIRIRKQYNTHDLFPEPRYETPLSNFGYPANYTYSVKFFRIA